MNLCVKKDRFLCDISTRISMSFVSFLPRKSQHFRNNKHLLLLLGFFVYGKTCDIMSLTRYAIAFEWFSKLRLFHQMICGMERTLCQLSLSLFWIWEIGFSLSHSCWLKMTEFWIETFVEIEITENQCPFKASYWKFEKTIKMTTISLCT